MTKASQTMNEMITVKSLEGDPEVLVVARIVRAIGVLRLWHRALTDTWYVSLNNRTYSHVHTIGADKLADWRKEFGLTSES